MKISSDTLSILKNFSDINDGIHFKKGSLLATWHPAQFILAEATIKEEIPQDFTVFDLRQFLSVNSLFDEPEYSFESDKVIVTANNRSVNFLFSEPSLVLDPENRTTKYRENTLKGSIAKANITKEELKSLKQSAAILALPDIFVTGQNDTITFSVQNAENTGTNSFKVVVKGEVQEDFSSIMRCEHLKMLDGDYEFVSHPKLAYFKNVNTPIEYWIAYQSKL